MLTKRDIQLLKEALKEDFVTKSEFCSFQNEMSEFQTEMYAFRREMYDFRKDMYDFREKMYEFRKEINNNLLQFKDDILWEIKSIREETAITIGYRGLIEDHEERIQKIEKNSPFSSAS